ncbi:hypothetical protein MKEN_01074700 [Mycena kentingensis (nom. inval.)]|nr:hypothetical protein MKEN_01074700 [Mycena kentingensis (nom. inval.)]
MSYEVELPASWEISPVFHITLLRKWNPPVAEHQKTIPPPPEDVRDGETVYEVEEILAVRRPSKNSKTLRYFVKWKGYPREEWTWEKRAFLEGAEEALAEFYDKYPNMEREELHKGKWRIIRDNTAKERATNERLNVTNERVEAQQANTPQTQDIKMEDVEQALVQVLQQPGTITVVAVKQPQVPVVNQQEDVVAQQQQDVQGQQLVCCRTAATEENAPNKTNMLTNMLALLTINTDVNNLPLLPLEQYGELDTPKDVNDNDGY